MEYLPVSIAMTRKHRQVRLPKIADSSGGPSLAENVRSFFQTCQFFDVCLVVKVRGLGWLV